MEVVEADGKFWVVDEYGCTSRPFKTEAGAKRHLIREMFGERCARMTDDEAAIIALVEGIGGLRELRGMLQEATKLLPDGRTKDRAEFVLAESEGILS